MTKHSLSQTVFSVCTNFEKSPRGQSSEKIPYHQLCQIAMSLALEGENISNKLGLAYMLGHMPCLYDTLCQSQLHAKRQT